MLNMSNISAVRKVAARHKMVAEDHKNIAAGWEVQDICPNFSGAQGP